MCVWQLYFLVLFRPWSHCSCSLSSFFISRIRKENQYTRKYHFATDWLQQMPRRSFCCNCFCSLLFAIVSVLFCSTAVDVNVPLFCVLMLTLKMLGCCLFSLCWILRMLDCVMLCSSSLLRWAFSLTLCWCLSQPSELHNRCTGWR